ncbi:MAG: TerB family tellurite resistance protein [Gemmatimonadota bacterium]|nr:MAG: TerB family tellurite resistance protein [Gemmatimonadota bacterium]
MTDRSQWSLIHHLAYVYSAIAFSDGSISEDELEVFCRNLHNWVPQEDPQSLKQTVESVAAVLAEDKGRGELGHLHRSIGIVADELDDEARAEALTDLLEIADADGRFAPGENALLLRLRQAWGEARGA